MIENEISGLFQSQLDKLSGEPIQRFRQTIKQFRDDGLLVTSVFGTRIKFKDEIVPLDQVVIGCANICFIATHQEFISDSSNDYLVFSPEFATCQLLDIRLENGFAAAVHCLPHTGYVREKVALFEKINAIKVIGKQSYVYADQLKWEGWNVSNVDFSFRYHHFQFFGHYKTDGSVKLIVESQEENEILFESM